MRSKQTTILRLINQTLLYLMMKCPVNTRIDHRTKEKLEKYQDLQREFNVFGRARQLRQLETVQKSFMEWLVILDMVGDRELL